MVHNSSRALNPVGDAVRMVEAYLNKTGTYSSEDVENALEALRAAYERLKTQSPLEFFAAIAEQTYNFRRESIATIVDQVVSLYKPLAAMKSLSIIVKPSVRIMDSVEIDADKYYVAVLNLIDNAVKYSHSGKDVVISASKVGQFVELIVDDFGQGIDDDESEMIYERGKQGRRSARAEREPGEGLGLYQARIIARAHGGEVSHSCVSGPRHLASRQLEGFRVRFSCRVLISREVDQKLELMECSRWREFYLWKTKIGK